MKLNNSRETAKEATKSESAQVIQSRFTTNPNGSFLWEGEWASEYEQITTWTNYRPGIIEKELIIENLEVLAKEIGKVVIMLAPGDCTKEAIMLQHHPNRDQLEIISLEWSMQQAGKTRQVLQKISDKKNQQLRHKPEFHIMNREKAWLKTFNRQNSEPITYTNLGFNIAMQELEKTRKILEGLFRPRLLTQDKIIFSYHQTPEESKKRSYQKKSLQAYRDEISEKFVFNWITRQLQKVWIIFNPSERTYDVQYNEPENQIEIGIKSKKDWERKLDTNTTQFFKKNEKITVYVSKRRKEWQIDNMLEEAGLRRKRTTHKNGVALVIADAKPKMERYLYYWWVALLLLLSLSIAWLQRTKETKRKIIENLEQVDRKKSYEKPSYKRYGEFGSIDTLTGQKLLQRREKMSQQIANYIVNIYDCPENMSTTLALIVKDKIKEVEDRLNFDSTEWRETMDIICNEIVPQIESLIAASGWNIRPYHEFDWYEQQIYNTLFNIKENTRIVTIWSHDPEWMDRPQTFWPYVVLPLNRSYGLLRENKFYTDGRKIYVKPEFANEYKDNEVLSWYSWYESGSYEQSILRWIIFWKSKVIQKAFNIICERHTQWYKDPNIAEQLTDIRLEKYVNGWYKTQDANNPSPKYIQDLIKEYEKKYPFEHEIQKHKDAIHNTIEYNQIQQTLSWDQRWNPIPSFFPITELSQYSWEELKPYTTISGKTYVLYKVQGNDGNRYLVGAQKNEGEWRETTKSYVGTEEILEVLKEQIE